MKLGGPETGTAFIVGRFEMKILLVAGCILLFLYKGSLTDNFMFKYCQ
jgi:hypothetical protein